MAELEEIEDIVRRNVEVDIRENYGQDPLGDSIYLYFVLSKRLSSPSIDNLIDWSNNWIDEILVKKKATRFFDRDITSAVFNHYVLKLAGRLKVSIDTDTLGNVLQPNIKDDYYFGNPTYTALILMATQDFRDRIESYEAVLSNLERALERRAFLSDAKNIVFSSMLFNRLDKTNLVRHLLKHCLGMISRDNIRFDDRVYYAWTLWDFRKLMPQAMMTIRDFTEKTLDDFSKVLKGVVVEEAVSDFYGQDVHSRVSKIALALCLDLVIDYNSKKIHSSAIDIRMVFQKIDSLGWTDIGSMLKNAIAFFDEGKTKEACDNLRMGLMLVLVKTVEQVTDRAAPVAKGQTPDPNKVLKPLVEKGFLSDQQRSLIANSWSYVSELAHVEKRGGTPPSEDETRYGLQLVLSAIELITKNLK